MTLMARMRWGTVAVLGCAAVLYAGDKKDKPTGAKQVDAGSFGVFVKGQRVVTETFSVKQENGVSIVKSELKETGSSSSGQRSELEMTSSADLVKYEWSDGNGSLVVTPNNDFLLEKITTSPTSKTAEQPFLMPSTSAILDNNFFVHREVLAWRYLTTSCRNERGVPVPEGAWRIRRAGAARSDLDASTPGAGGKRKDQNRRNGARTVTVELDGRSVLLGPLGG